MTRDSDRQLQLHRTIEQRRFDLYVKATRGGMRTDEALALLDAQYPFHPAEPVHREQVADDTRR